MKFSIKQKFLSLGLVMCMSVGLVGCSVSQFDTYLNAIVPAVVDILDIVAAFQGKVLPTNQDALPAKISADVAAVENIEATYQSAAASAKPGLLGEVNAAFTTLNSDLSSVEQLAQISDPKTQAQVQVLIGLVESGVQLAEGLVSVSPNAPKLTPGELVDSFNKTLDAKTGNAKVDAIRGKLHRVHAHSKLVRLVTFGRAK
jgi:hypothetical protein